MFSLLKEAIFKFMCICFGHVIFYWYKHRRNKRIDWKPDRISLGFGEYVENRAALLIMVLV